MPKPTNKKELLQAASNNFKQLMEYISTLPFEKKTITFPKSMLNRNIRDVLGHIHHWHLLFQVWYKVGMSGSKPDMPALGYTWKDTPRLNVWIQKQYSNIALEEITKLLNNSHNELMEIIDKHSEAALFEKKKYAWTGTTSLAAYLIGATSSHYDWAIKVMKKGCSK